jgi:hypothetical protein
MAGYVTAQKSHWFIQLMCFDFFEESHLITFLYPFLASEELLEPLFGENKVRDFLESMWLLEVTVSCN